MPLFTYFPDNYMWSLAVMRCLTSGGMLGEIHRIGAPLLDSSTQGPTGDLDHWHREWLGLAEVVDQRALEARASGQLTTALGSFLRAQSYYFWAEAFLRADDPRKSETLHKQENAFRAAVELTPGWELVEIAYEGAHLPAFFVPAVGGVSPAPMVIVLGGLDSCKEELIPHALMLASRGISALVMEGPGQGAALKLRGLISRHDYEVPIGAAVDYLETRSDVDPKRIGLLGASMGGYYAARAAAFERRLAACVILGAQYDYRETWLRRRDPAPGAAGLPAPPHHLFAVLGADGWDDALERLRPFTLNGVADKIECPILVTHGELDRQILVEDAYRFFDDITAADKELRVFTDAEGGSAHCHLDCVEPAFGYVGDWLVARLQTKVAA